MSRAWRLVLLVVPAGLAVGAAAIALVLMSDHEDSPLLTILLGGLIGWSFIAAGVVARLRRPHNRTGLLLIAVGFSWFAGALLESNQSLLFTLGYVSQALFAAVFVHLLLAYPTGRLQSRSDRAIVAVGYVLASASNLVVALFDRTPIDGCDGCPANAFLVMDSDRTTAIVEAIVAPVAAVLLLGVAAALVQRWRSAGAAGRRLLAPVFIAGGAALALLGILVALENVSAPAAEAIGSAASIAMATVPFFFLWGLLRSRLARADATRLLVETPERPTPAEAQQGLRRALHDPTLELLYWLPERGTYVDTEGHPRELPPDGGARTATRIAYEERPVAALVHDPSLREEPELVEAVVAAARLAIEKDRLQAELRARLDELQRERDFVRAVVNSAPSYFCVVDSNGAIIRFNDTLARASGRQDNERTRGRPFWEVFVADRDCDAFRAWFERSLHDDDAGEHEACLPAPPREPLTVVWTSSPITDEQGRERLLLCGLDVTERTRQQHELEQLYRQLAERLNELRASRARIVEAGDQERRRLERNLHDGAQQRLVSLSLSLRLAHAKLASDPDGAEDLLRAAGDELALALEELRELARGIHPAVLTERGLGPALESLATRAPLPVELEAVPDGRLPGPVEAAAFYVVSEALANVAKYADASTVSVRVGRDDGRAVVEVEDDGVGGADPGRGSGLRGLADRVEALDGRLVVDSAPGTGTRIRAEIPVTAEDAGPVLATGSSQ